MGGGIIRLGRSYQTNPDRPGPARPWRPARRALKAFISPLNPASAATLAWAASDPRGGPTILCRIESFESGIREVDSQPAWTSDHDPPFLSGQRSAIRSSTQADAVIVTRLALGCLRCHGISWEGSGSSRGAAGKQFQRNFSLR